MSRRSLFALCLVLPVMAALLALVRAGAAQESGQNPTPIVVELTPAAEGSTPTPGGAFAPDRFEPNDDADRATPIGFQLETGLTLIGDDVDAFSSALKAGQILRVSTTVHGRLDTRLRLYWDGQLAAENDDRAPDDLGSTIIFTAPAGGTAVILVDRVTEAGGSYDLETALVAPTATPTWPATGTPTPTPTPSPSPAPLFRPDGAEPNDQAGAARPITPGSRGRYTIGPGDEDFFSFIGKAGVAYSCETNTDEVDTLLVVHAGDRAIGMNDDRAPGRVDSLFTWQAIAEQTVIVQLAARGGSYGAYELICQAEAPSASPAGSSAPARATPTPLATATMTATVTITVTEPVSLTVRYLGPVEEGSDAPATTVRLLVYYDANNDRAPGPGEGIPNISVLAVDALGQRLAQVFTNAQGEAAFNLHGQAAASVARLIVPFVPAWSARVRPGEVNDGIVLGLPAVRLPVFFPVAAPETTATE